MKYCHDKVDSKVSLAQFATAWVLANPAISSVIAGPRTLQQWQDYLPALDYAVTTEDETLIDSLVRPGHPSTPGYTDPAYPLNGREVRSFNKLAD
jgi:aryl-alcohol dehydrogenase-like predicted oxidoreductase